MQPGGRGFESHPLHVVSPAFRAALILLLGLSSCRGSDRGRPTIIPRYREHTETFEFGKVQGMRYDPRDIPLTWLDDSSIVIAHQERYSIGGTTGATCSGSGIFVVPAIPDARAARPLVGGKAVCEALESRDGMAAAPAADWFVYAVNRRGARSLLTHDISSDSVREIQAACTVELEQPSVSRDGRWVAAVGICSPGQTAWAVYVLRADGTRLREVSALKDLVRTSPAWSPDGRRLVLQRDRGLAVVDLDTRQLRALGDGGLPAWSPDGKWIALARSKADTFTIEVIRPDGTERREVFRNREAGTYNRGWGPRHEGEMESGLVWSPDARQLAFARRYEAGTSVWRLVVDSTTLMQLTAPDRRR